MRQAPALVWCSNEHIESIFENYHPDLREKKHHEEIAIFKSETTGKAPQDILAANTLYQSCLRRIKRMESFLAALDQEDIKLIDMRYFKKRPWEEIAQEYHLSLSTVSKRRKPKILNKARLVMFGVVSR